MTKFIRNEIIKKNFKKILFTEGPTSLSETNISNLKPCFGREDKAYHLTEKSVLNNIKKISGHKNIVTTQESGSTVLEMVSLNFLSAHIGIVLMMCGGTCR